MPGYYAASDIPLTGWSDPRLQRRDGEVDSDFADRVTDQVFRSIYHCAPTYYDQEWATAIIGRVNPTFLGDQGVLDPAYVRCGFCSQVSFILAETLTRAGIHARPYSLGDGHVVTELVLDGDSYLADPDIGIGPFVVPWGDPEAVAMTIRTQYAGVPSASWRDLIVEIYSDHSDDGPYYSMEFLEQIAENQGQVLALQTPYVVIVLLSSLLFVGAALGSPGSAGKRRENIGAIDAPPHLQTDWGGKRMRRVDT